MTHAPRRPVPFVAFLFVATLSAGLPRALAAQATVPATMQGVEGGGGTNIPFGGSLACRYQCIYDAATLPWSGPQVITGLRIRPDLNNGNPTPAKGFLEVSVKMSTTGRTSATSSADFAENYGLDALWVIQNRVIQLPAQPDLTPLPPAPVPPRPANIDLLFDTPWAYGLTPAVNGMPAPANLLVEIWIHDQPSGLYRVDNLSSCVAPTATFGNVGPACAVPNGQPMELTGDTSMLAGSSYSWHVSGAPPSAPFSVAVNLTDQGNFAGIPGFALPYPLFDQSNPSLPSPLVAPLGGSAPDCWLNVDFGAVFGGITDAAGTGTVSAVLPAGTEYVGTTFYAQALAISNQVNTLRIITSGGRETSVCGPLGVARVFAYYDNSGTPPPPPPPTGSRSLGVGLVLEFY